MRYDHDKQRALLTLHRICINEMDIYSTILTKRLFSEYFFDIMNKISKNYLSYIYTNQMRAWKLFFKSEQLFAEICTHIMLHIDAN